MKITRRNFLKGSALTTAFFLTGFNSPIYSYTKNKKNLVIISLRGAMDGLSAIPVIGDKNLQKKRPDIIIPEDLKLNSDFAIHPALKTFHELWKGGKSAFVHATNIP